jgi:hypothetical protein
MSWPQQSSALIDARAYTLGFEIASKADCAAANSQKCTNCRLNAFTPDEGCGLGEYGCWATKCQVASPPLAFTQCINGTKECAQSGTATFACSTCLDWSCGCSTATGTCPICSCTPPGGATASHPVWDEWPTCK